MNFKSSFFARLRHINTYKICLSFTLLSRRENSKTINNHDSQFWHFPERFFYIPSESKYRKGFEHIKIFQLRLRQVYFLPLSHEGHEGFFLRKNKNEACRDDLSDGFFPICRQDRQVCVLVVYGKMSFLFWLVKG